MLKKLSKITNKRTYKKIQTNLANKNENFPYQSSLQMPSQTQKKGIKRGIHARTAEYLAQGRGLQQEETCIVGPVPTRFQLGDGAPKFMLPSDGQEGAAIEGRHTLRKPQPTQIVCNRVAVDDGKPCVDPKLACIAAFAAAAAFCCRCRRLRGDVGRLGAKSQEIRPMVVGIMPRPSEQEHRTA